MEINSKEATLLKHALIELIKNMESELTVRKSGGNESLKGDKQLESVKSLKTKMTNYLQEENVVENPLSEYPILTGY